jgi:hypothetical protein
MSEEKNQQNPVISDIEKLYPEMTKEYKKIMREQYELFCKKMNNYGKGNIMLGGDCDVEEDRKLALMGTTIRLNDKSNRLVNMILKNKENTVNESIEDTFQDMVNYSIISLIVQRAKWK